MAVLRLQGQRDQVWKWQTSRAATSVRGKQGLFLQATPYSNPWGPHQALATLPQALRDPGQTLGQAPVRP